MTRKITRRRLMQSSAVALAGISIVPRHVLGLGQTPPSEIIRIAGIGAGGQGAGDILAISGEKTVKFVALCDADDRPGKDTFQKFPDATRFRDYRKMFDAMANDIDAVVIAIPDHSHAAAVLAAINHGKHVYCEKPLAHSIHEVRELMRVAKEKDVVTQLGNQGHASDSIRLLCEWIWDGAIGNVHTIHAGCNANHSKIGQLGERNDKHDVPASLDWDQWLGPAQFRPFNPMYIEGKWRGWMPFGTGTIGDWTCHVIDPAFWALDLAGPLSVRVEAKNYDPIKHADTFPAGSIITYDFPAKGNRGPVKLVWHDGIEPIPRPDDLEPDRKMPEAGAIVLGEKGGIMYGSHGAGGVRMYPETKMKEYKLPRKTIPRVRGHHQDWIDSIRNGKKAGSDFSYGGPLTQIALLGVIGTRLLGQQLDWDGNRFTNSEAANKMIKPDFRPGWGL